MVDILKKICDDKLELVAQRRKLVSYQELESKIAEQVFDQRKFIDSIANKITKGKNAIIAEIKKASPSKGIIRQDFDVAKLAADYENGGACCLSVLTDTKYFMGDDLYISLAKKSSKLPVLRKDFMLDPYQILESKIIGADCILLIMAALSDSQAAELENLSHSLNMDVLIEVHDEIELERALKLKSRLVGINNRNLKTLSIDLNITKNLAKLMPNSRIAVCESGIYNKNDVESMNREGINTFLIGESLMKQENVSEAVAGLLN